MWKRSAGGFRRTGYNRALTRLREPRAPSMPPRHSQSTGTGASVTFTSRSPAAIRLSILPACELCTTRIPCLPCRRTIRVRMFRLRLTFCRQGRTKWDRTGDFAAIFESGGKSERAVRTVRCAVRGCSVSLFRYSGLRAGLGAHRNRLRPGEAPYSGDGLSVSRGQCQVTFAALHPGGARRLAIQWHRRPGEPELLSHTGSQRSRGIAELRLDRFATEQQSDCLRKFDGGPLRSGDFW